jgi:hypothetical protein
MQVIGDRLAALSPGARGTFFLMEPFRAGRDASQCAAPTCLFCGKTAAQVAIMVTGDNGNICNECVGRAAKRVAEHHAKKREGSK